MSTPGHDSATKTAASKLESDVDAEDSRGEEKHQELKSPSRRSNQMETKKDVGSVSTQKIVIFMLS